MTACGSVGLGLESRLELWLVKNLRLGPRPGVGLKPRPEQSLLKREITTERERGLPPVELRSVISIPVI